VRAVDLGAEETIALEPGMHDVAEAIRRRSRHGHGPDVVIEAVGLPETCEAAIRAVRKGGVVNLFGGCPADSRIGIDSERLHYQELTIKSTFHHTPESIRRAFRLIADGHVDPNLFITGEASLQELPDVLRRMSRGGDGLKTAILTWGRE
jgi:L-iditol 2-dehydrogenase